MTLLEKLIEYSEKGGFTPSYHDETNELVFTEFVERYAYHFWEENSMWHYGRSGIEDTCPAKLTTPDYHIALRWLIYNVAGDARYHLRFHPFHIPPRPITAEKLAPGWRFALDEDSFGHLIDPEGIPLRMRLNINTPRAIELIRLSHLMAYTPEQLLTSYMDPYGRPHLTHYLHEDSALARMGNPLPTPIPPLKTTQS